MQETMDHSRRWSGFVCPDCRFVFRVPRDHDGHGVVCPSCRRMLRIPMPGDRPPPLVAALRVAPAEEPPAGDAPANPDAHHPGTRRRKKKSRRGDSHEWDRSSGTHHRRSLSLQLEKRRMLWMLAGGASLFALIVTGVLFALHGQATPPPHATGPTGSNNPAAADQPPPAPAAPAGRTDAAFLAEAEPLTKKFLEAGRIEDLLPLVRDPATAEPRMRAYYANGKIHPPGMAQFNSIGTVIRAKGAFTINVHTGDFATKSIAYVDSPQGLKIDWECWVGWSEMPWNEFLATKPTTPRVFRLNLQPCDYYNFAFADDKKWQAYQIVSPDGEHSLYGYAERGSETDRHLPPATEPAPAGMMLALKFPPNATSANQVLIDRFITEGWVQTTDSPP